jgi:hypothetical protein
MASVGIALEPLDGRIKAAAEVDWPGEDDLPSSQELLGLQEKQEDEEEEEQQGNDVFNILVVSMDSIQLK